MLKLRTTNDALLTTEDQEAMNDGRVFKVTGVWDTPTYFATEKEATDFTVLPFTEAFIGSLTNLETSEMIIFAVGGHLVAA